MVEFDAPRNTIVNNTQTENRNKMNYRKIAIHVVLYAGLMITFEYWFFNQIVMKYKVISNEEIEYLFADKISSYTS